MSRRRIGLWALASASVIGALASGVGSPDLRGQGDLRAAIAGAPAPAVTNPQPRPAQNTILSFFLEGGLWQLAG